MMTATMMAVTVTTADVRCLAGAMGLKVRAKDLGAKIRIVGPAADVASMWSALMTLGCTDCFGRQELATQGAGANGDLREALAYKPGAVRRAA